MGWFKTAKNLGQSNIVVYQGRREGDSPSNFYSTSRQEASGYGQVRTFLLTAGNIFDSLNKEHLDLLFEKVGAITDPYDDKVFNTADEYYNSKINGIDTWESLEPYTVTIAGMGFDVIKIYEGGIENYYVMYPQKDITEMQGEL